MKKVLIVGEVYSENLGDGVICEVVNDFFSKMYDTRLLDISGRESYTISNNYHFDNRKEKIRYKKYCVKKFLYSLGYKNEGKTLKKIINKFEKQFMIIVEEFKPDIILFAGGQMFIDTFIYQVDYICNYSLKNNIKVIFNSCGIGELLFKDKLSSILNNESVKYLSLRDGYSKINSQFPNLEIIDSFDTAILSNKIYTNVITKNNTLGIGIMFSSLHSVNKQINFWFKMLSSLLNNNYDFKVFTNGSCKDQSFAEYILKILNLDPNKYLLARPTNPLELVSNIVSFDSIISMRLHSLIIAYSFDIPTIAISWDEKVKKFYKKINREDFCYNLYDAKLFNSKKLLDKISKEYDYDKKEKIIKSIEENLNNICKIIDEK